MKISRQNDQYDILVSREELEILANCHREALNMLSKESFEMRVGEKPAVVKGRMEQLVKASREL